MCVYFPRTCISSQCLQEVMNSLAQSGDVSQGARGMQGATGGLPRMEKETDTVPLYHAALTLMEKLAILACESLKSSTSP